MNIGDLVTKQRGDVFTAEEYNAIVSHLQSQGDINLFVGNGAAEDIATPNPKVSITKGDVVVGSAHFTGNGAVQVASNEAKKITISVPNVTDSLPGLMTPNDKKDIESLKARVINAVGAGPTSGATKATFNVDNGSIGNYTGIFYISFSSVSAAFTSAITSTVIKEGTTERPLFWGSSSNAISWNNHMILNSPYLPVLILGSVAIVLVESYQDPETKRVYYPNGEYDVYKLATTENYGLMSSTDKAKVNKYPKQPLVEINDTLSYKGGGVCSYTISNPDMSKGTIVALKLTSSEYSYNKLEIHINDFAYITANTNSLFGKEMTKDDILYLTLVVGDTMAYVSSYYYEGGGFTYTFDATLS